MRPKVVSIIIKIIIIIKTKLQWWIWWIWPLKNYNKKKVTVIAHLLASKEKENSGKTKKNWESLAILWWSIQKDTKNEKDQGTKRSKYNGILV